MRDHSPQPIPDDFESEDSFLSFLLYSEAFRRFGVEHTPPSRKTPTLDPEKTWTVNLTTSQPFPPRGIELPPLWDMLPNPSDRLKDIAKTYRARSKARTGN